MQREQEVAAQLLQAQQQAEREKTELAHRHAEHATALQQQHDAELSTKLGEHQRVLAACAALESELKAQVLLEQQASLQLRQSMAEVQHHLDMVHTSLSWQLTAPFRSICNFLLGKSSKEISLKIMRLENNYSPEIYNSSLPLITSSQSKKNNDIVNNSPYLSEKKNEIFSSDTRRVKETKDILEKLLLTKNTMNPILHVQDLLKMSGEHLVMAIYETLLEREPDAQGMMHYSTRLQQGYGRVHVLAEIADSKEARLKAVELPGLAEILREHKSTRSWWRRLVTTPSRQEKSLNRVEELLDTVREDARRLEQRLDARLDKLEAKILALHSNITYSPDVTVDVRPETVVTQIQSFEDKGQQSQLWLKRIQSIQGCK